MLTPFSGNKAWRVVLALLLVYGLGYRIHAVLVWKTGLSNDESVSYMCAAATAGKWETSIGDMVDRPLVVADIQRFYDRPTTFQFRTIARDMARYDVHPPLYFWLLHTIHVLWGTSDCTGAAVNIVLGLVVLVLLYRTARTISGSGMIALVATTVWYLSPAAVQIDLEARPYQLLAVLAMASYMLGEHLITGRRTRLTWIGFAVVNALGLLTHLYFSFLLLPGALLMLRNHGLGRSTITYAGSLMLSAIVMVLVYPEFIEFVTLYGDRPKNAEDTIQYVERMKVLTYASMQYFTEPRVLRYAFMAILVLVGLWLIRAARSHGAMDARTSVGRLIIVVGWWAGFTTIFFLVGISPAQAAGEQYYAYVWPLLSIVCVILARSGLVGQLKHLALGAYLVQLVISFTLAVQGSPYVRTAVPAEWNLVMGKQELLMTNEGRRTALPRIARALPANLPLYIMRRKKPDLEGIHSIALLYRVPKTRPAPHFGGWLEENGLHLNGEVQTVHRYELRSFSR